MSLFFREQTHYFFWVVTFWQIVVTTLLNTFCNENSTLLQACFVAEHCLKYTILL